MRVVANNAARTRIAVPGRLQAIAACGGGAREAVKAQVVRRSDKISYGSRPCEKSRVGKIWRTQFFQPAFSDA
jgi:hypothetical protein